jgi:hypothetical protein
MPYNLDDFTISSQMKQNDLNTYSIDSMSLRLKCYRLLCLFRANKEIARLANPEAPNDLSSRLEAQFFPWEMTHLLLELAIGLRVLDDQMRQLPDDSDTRQAYSSNSNRINHKYDGMILLFDKATLRDACNKIIHATVVQPHSIQGSSEHQIDGQNAMAWADEMADVRVEQSAEPEPVNWHYLSGYVRLGGEHNGKQWWKLLDVPLFVEVVYCMLLNDSYLDHGI